MGRVINKLILLLLVGLGFIAPASTDATMTAPVENRASGSATAPNNLIGIEARLSTEAVRENIPLAYDLVSDDAVAAKSGVRILERDGNVVEAAFRGAAGEARVITEISREGETLVLRGTHISGNATLKEAFGAAREFGRQQGARFIRIEGGVRTTGANPGHVPRPITLETGL